MHLGLMACKLYPSYDTICQVYMATGEYEYSIAVVTVWSVQSSKHALLVPVCIYSHYINSDQADRSAVVRSIFFLVPFCCLLCCLAMAGGSMTKKGSWTPQNTFKF